MARLNSARALCLLPIESSLKLVNVLLRDTRHACAFLACSFLPNNQATRRKPFFAVCCLIFTLSFLGDASSFFLAIRCHSSLSLSLPPTHIVNKQTSKAHKQSTQAKRATFVCSLCWLACCWFCAPVVHVLFAAAFLAEKGKRSVKGRGEGRGEHAANAQCSGNTDCCSAGDCYPCR